MKELRDKQTGGQNDCAVIIPCCNEARTIGELVREVQQWVPFILVVDDGSTDGTARVARAAGASVLTHTRNKGKGAALQSGLEYVHRAGFARALLMDGDMQHLPSDITQFFACAEATHADLIVGNRMHQAVVMPWVRRWVNRWMSQRLSRLTGMHLPDSQCGFRLVNLIAWRRLPMRTSHFEIESEMLVRFARAGRRIEFVPVQVRYGGEQSKIRPMTDTLRWFCYFLQAGKPQPECVVTLKAAQIPTVKTLPAAANA